MSPLNTVVSNHPPQITGRILIFMGVVLFILLITALTGFSFHEHNEFDMNINARAYRLQRMFRLIIDHDAETMNGLLDFIQQDTCLQQSWQVFNKKELLICAEHIFKKLKISLQNY